MNTSPAFRSTTFVAVLALFAAGALSACTSSEPDSNEPGSAEPLAQVPDEAAETAASFDSPPKPVKTVDPKYPDPSRRNLEEGTVFVQLTIDAAGAVTNAEVVEERTTTGELLRDAALVAARQWTFTPATLEGEPVLATVVVPFEFAVQ